MPTSHDPLYKRFRNEQEFVGWLALNLTWLARELGCQLRDPRFEVPVAGKRADLVCGSDVGNIVVECQLGVSDDQHLAQLVLYVNHLKPTHAVWVAERFRDIHVKYCDDQSRSKSSSCSFHCIRVGLEPDTGEPIRIADPTAGPLVATGSSATGVRVGPAAGRHEEFWQACWQWAEQRKMVVPPPRRFSNQPYLLFDTGYESVRYALSQDKDRSPSVEVCFHPDWNIVSRGRSLGEKHLPTLPLEENERYVYQDLPKEKVWACGIARTNCRSKFDVDRELIFNWYWTALKRLKSHFDPLLPP